MLRDEDQRAMRHLVAQEFRALKFPSVSLRSDQAPTYEVDKLER